MTWKTTGGRAFPVVSNDTVLEEGMTLRDWFAGQALAGIMGPNYEWFTASTETGSRVHEAAGFAYSLADAMLEARNAGQ